MSFIFDITDTYAKKMSSRQLMAIIMMMFGFILSILYFEKFQDKNFGWFAILSSALFISMGILAAFYDLFRAQKYEPLDEKNEFGELITELNTKIEEFGNIVLQSDGGTIDIKKEIANSISRSVRESLSKDGVQNRLDPKIATRSLALSQLSKARMRLKSEVAEVAKRAKTNLVFGSTISMFGIFIIAYTAFTSNVDTSDPVHAAVSLSPRILLGLLVEFFALFFLRLYKRTFEEVRHYHNEITNIDARAASLAVAVGAGNDDAIKDVVQKLACLERNFLLEKGQSTAELRKVEAEAQASANTLDILLKALDSFKKTK